MEPSVDRPVSPTPTRVADTAVHPINLTPVEAADAKDREADACIASGDLDGAVVALQKAIFFRPEHAPFHAKLARVYWDACDLKSAMACYRKLIAVDPQPSQRIKDQFASLLDLHAFSLLRLGEPPSVTIAYLTEAIALNSLEEMFWLHRALAYIQLNAMDKALKDVDHCVNLNGRDAEYFVLRAKLHWKLHMHEKATQDIHKAARLQPDHPEVVAHEQRLRNESQTIYAEACRHLLVQRFAEAIKCLSTAAEISPDETKIYLLRASAYREAKELQAAMKDIDQAMTCHKHKLAATQGKSPKKQQQMNSISEAAEDHTKEYRDIVTQRNLILNDLALRFLQDKSYQIALNAMNQVIQGELEVASRFKEPFATPQYYVNRGDAYRGLENPHAALADYHHAQEMVPENLEIRSRVALIHYRFGIELFNQGQFAKAEVEFARAIAEDESVASYHVRKGDAARYQERHHVACESYLEAVRLNPHDADTKNKLLQYAVDPNRLTGASAAKKTETKSPRCNQSQRGVAPPSALGEALRMSQKKNKMVKDLYANRPVLPPQKAKHPGS